MKFIWSKYEVLLELCQFCIGKMVTEVMPRVRMFSALCAEIFFNLFFSREAALIASHYIEGHVHVLAILLLVAQHNRFCMQSVTDDSNTIHFL